MHPRFSTILLGVALISSAACKPGNQRRADRAADRAIHAMDKLDDASSPRQTLSRAFEVADTTADFVRHRDARIAILSAQRDVIATQPDLIMTIATSVPLTTAGRNDVDAKVQTLDMRIDDLGNQLNELRSIGPDDWKAIDNAATASMHQLDDARASAWKALQDAPRIDHQS